MKRVIPLLLLLAIGGAVAYFHPQWFRKPTMKMCSSFRETLKRTKAW